jgi:PRC-barrel domain
MADPAPERPAIDEIEGWFGWRLDDIGGGGVGKVEGAYVDADSGDPEWLLVRVGRFGRRSLVPVRTAVGAVGRVWVPYPRETLRGAPRVEPGEPLDLERETALAEHFATDRAERLAGRPPGSVMSRPV